MKIFIALAAKQVGKLYHVTSPYAMQQILKNNEFVLSTQKFRVAEGAINKHTYFLSTTRDIRGGYHYRNGGILIELDGDLLSQNLKIIPTEYWGVRSPGTNNTSESRPEAEERVVSDKPSITDAIKYIKRVMFIVGKPSVQSYVTMFEGRTEPNDEEWVKYLDDASTTRGSAFIVRRLKINKIPFGMYATVEDAIRDKGIRYPIKLDKRVYNAGRILGEREAASKWYPLLMGTADAKERKRLYTVDEVARRFRLFIHNASKPTSRGPIVEKILRLTKRLGLDTAEKVAEYIWSKNVEQDK